MLICENSQKLPTHHQQKMHHFPIQMVDLQGQYQHIKQEIDTAVQEIMEKAQFINGPAVREFEQNLANYLGVKHVIACANGTDALQIALMALELEQGDEVIVPAFTYAATAEVIALLKLVPVMVDVDKNTFNTTAEIIENAITSRTKAIIPVHLFGQASDMEEILLLAQKHQLYIIEDAAQSIGSDCTFKNGEIRKSGTIGDIACTSFFPSKNLGCYGDGGAMFTNNDNLAQKLRTIANHGQEKKYHHSIIGVNSRLDTIQAAILNIKLKKLDQYISARQQVAKTYDQAFNHISSILTPSITSNATHVYHQYTIQVKNEKRDNLKKYLDGHNIPSMIYYPIPLYKQEAFKCFYNNEALNNTEYLCNSVLSLPMHTEMQEGTLTYIIEKVKSFFE